MIEEIGGMREDLPRGEDNEFNSRIRKAGYDIYFDPQIECVYYARPTFESSCKQMFANGESIGHLFYVDRDSIGLRHFIPLLFVLGIIFGIIGSLVYLPIFYAFIAGISLYFLCDLVASFFAIRNHGLKYLLPLFILCFSVHVSYGVGIIKGLITGRKYK
jgi:GT2 family glycosyltransferase